MTHPRPAPRARADHRPEVDPACAGCPQVGLLRALRRAGVPAEGRLSCEPGEGLLLAGVARGEARLLVLAGPEEPDLDALPGWPAGSARLARVDPGALAEVEAEVERALADAGTTLLLAVAPCVLGAAASPPLAIHAARCNRCGGCLGLGCPAISDPGGEALVIDEAICSGCGRCAPLCRGRAIGPALQAVGARLVRAPGGGRRARHPALPADLPARRGAVAPPGSPGRCRADPLAVPRPTRKRRTPRP